MLGSGAQFLDDGTCFVQSIDKSIAGNIFNHPVNRRCQLQNNNKRRSEWPFQIAIIPHGSRHSFFCFHHFFQPGLFDLSLSNDSRFEIKMLDEQEADITGEKITYMRKEPGAWPRMRSWSFQYLSGTKKISVILILALCILRCYKKRSFFEKRQETERTQNSLNPKRNQNCAS